MAAFLALLLQAASLARAGAPTSPEVFHERLPWAADRAGELRVGDMLIDLADAELDDRLSGDGALAIVVHSRPWARGRLSVFFDPAVPEARRQLLFEACEAWSKIASVVCVPRTSEFSFVHVTPGEGCSAKVGAGLFAWNARRNLTLGENCWTRSILVHELGHAFGLQHEHQRADRDRYIRVNWENVDPAHRYSYAILRSEIDPAPYDFDSIMHYDDVTFSKGGGAKTFVGRPGFESKAASAGQAWQPSAGDAAAMARRYGKAR